MGGVAGEGPIVLLDVTAPDVTMGVTGTPEYAGGLVGLLESRGLIDNSTVTVDLDSDGAGSGSVGGLIGSMAPDSYMEDSTANVTLRVNNPTGDLTVGGIAGFIASGSVTSPANPTALGTSHAEGSIGIGNPTGQTTSVGGAVGRLATNTQLQNSWTSVNVAVTNFDSANSPYVGGFAGDVDSPTAEIEHSYSTGTVSPQVDTDGMFVGQFIGRRVIDGTPAFSAVNQGVHLNQSVTVDSVGFGPSDGVVSATLDQMRTPSFFDDRGYVVTSVAPSYVGTDNDIWVMIPNTTCTPKLWWQFADLGECEALPTVPSGSPRPETASSDESTLVAAPGAFSPGRVAPNPTAPELDILPAPEQEDPDRGEEAEQPSGEDGPVSGDATASGTSDDTPQGSMTWLWAIGLGGLGVALLIGGGVAFARKRM